MNASPLIDAPLWELLQKPRNNIQISKKEQKHSTNSVSCLINGALRISSCSMWSSKYGYTIDGISITLIEDSDIDVRIWKDDMDLQTT